jgi:predicted TIM-barrel fold metal-dependent hydrolase
MSTPDADAPIIDGHCHVFVDGMPFSPTAWTKPTYEYSTETYLAELDRHGISFGVISPASLYGTYNDYTLASLQAHPRLRGTVIVEPTVSRAELAAMAARGVVGVRWQWRRLDALPDLESFEYRAFLSRMADLGLHIELLVNSDVAPALLPALDRSGVKVVIDHFGAPNPREGLDGPGYTAILRAFENGRTWVKVSASHRVPLGMQAACMDKLLAHGGPERLIWGSDAPFVGNEGKVTFQDALDAFKAAAPDPKIRRAISDTGLRFYFF